MNKESACTMICIVSKNFAKTLGLKREFDVTLWRHKQRTPGNNDQHSPLVFTDVESYEIIVEHETQRLYAQRQFYNRKNIWYLAKHLVFVQQQNGERVAENKNNVLSVLRLMKV